MDIIPDALQLIADYVAEGRRSVDDRRLVSFTGIEASQYKNTVLAGIAG